ncbi:MAG: protein kinase [Bryobacteraceae bacterium]|nr:protein kinase [Bryobacteraceae bacterium]
MSVYVITGRTFGQYRAVAKIGEGGMGSVFLGERLEDFNQRVAIKVLLHGIGHEETRRRFLAERQVLAKLQHPDIVQLIDGGVTDDGLPFIVMDYVEGEPLDVYCDRAKLGLRERVALVKRVLEGVEYAHQRLLAHCDLKFANILVTADGSPRLLDFGVAKLLDPLRYGVTDAATRAALRPFTPEFASPEQLRGEELGTSTDIYSAGVILYRLLTGTHPFEGVVAQPLALLRATLEASPERPGARRPEVDGDLDAIVLKALRKEPEERFRTAAEFAGELGAWLDGRPIASRAGSTRYRLAKLASRHRVPVAAGVIAVLVLAAGAGGTLHTYWKAQTARARAEERFRDVRRITGSLLFEFHDAVRDLPGSTPAQEKLVGWSLEYLRRLAAQSRDDDRLRLELGEAYLRLGNLLGNPYEKNLGKGEEALSTLREGMRVVDGLQPSRNGGLLYARLLGARGEVDQSLEDAQQAARLLEDLATRYGTDAEVLMTASSQMETAGDLSAGEAARNWYEKARATSARIAELPPGPLTGRSRRSQVILSMKIGDNLAQTDLDAAIAQFERALREYRSLDAKLLAEPATRRAGGSLMRRYGRALAQAGRAEDAVRVIREGIAAAEANAKADASDKRAQWDLAVLYRILADAEEAAGRPAESAACLEKVLSTLDEGAPYGEALVRLARIQYLMGRREGVAAMSERGIKLVTSPLIRAEVLLAAQPHERRRAVEALETLRPLPDSPEVLALRAEAERQCGRWAQAKATAAQGLAMLPAGRKSEVGARLQALTQLPAGPGR